MDDGQAIIGQSSFFSRKARRRVLRPCQESFQMFLSCLLRMECIGIQKSRSFGEEMIGQIRLGIGFAQALRRNLLLDIVRWPH
jgi:hypothetical protein